MTYQVEGSKPVTLDKLYSVLVSKGYRGAKGPYFMGQFLKGRGKKLYEVSGNQKYLVGR